MAMNRKRGLLVRFLLLMSPGILGAATCCAKPQEGDGNLSKTSAPAAPAPENISSSDATQAAIEPTSHDDSLGWRLIKNFAQDQQAIWTVPAKFRPSDAEWLMPFGLALAGTLASDTEFSKHLSQSPSRLKDSNDFSNYGLAGLGALAGGLYLWGQITHDDHKKETGFLAGEAAADSLAVVYGFKYSFGRERPLTNDYQGNFWSGDDSFPSEHAAAAWSIASVVAHEYPGPFTQVLAYGMASAVSVSRLTAEKHFPTDVLVGAAIGWVSGEVTYRMHHDPELGGSNWETFAESRDYIERERPRQNMGTTFVELDSWVYPAFDRLTGLGYVHTAFGGLRPWTRMQCARLVEEASENLQGVEARDGASAIVDRLRQEFSYEMARLDGGTNTTAAIDSLYSRTVSLSGPTLTDGFHFGQTIAYDFGRPFERGTNLQEGGAFRATLGPIAIYVRAEYQHAPGAPAPSDAVREIIALRDLVPEPPGVAISPINRPRFLDAYIGVNLSNWQLLIGRQSLSWGPGPGGSMLLSDNSEPMDMIRFVNSEPVRLPGELKYLGPVTLDQFIGRLGGHTFHQQPTMYGNKISVKPFPNFEFGYERTVVIGGKGGDPLNFSNFLHSFFGQQSSSTAGNSVPGASSADLDWTFTVPKIGNHLVLYGDWFCNDNPIALVSPTECPYRPGFYIPHFPHISKLDLHFEAANSATSLIGHHVPNTGNLTYWNFIYRDGYTNDGFLIGNVVGRLGQTYSGWLTYWLSERDSLQLTYKNSQVSSAFIPGGGAFQNYGVESDVSLKSGLYLKSQFQYERISHFPILFKGPQNNFAAIVEFGFRPDSKAH
jgi:Capsule assembly protein Wzi/PAP2 superfamily